MDDLEFDILDELYFVQPFQYIKEELVLEEEVLKEALAKLLNKGWVKCLRKASDEVVAYETSLFEQNYKEYLYLATKEGLLAHNHR